MGLQPINIKQKISRRSAKDLELWRLFLLFVSYAFYCVQRTTCAASSVPPYQRSHSTSTTLAQGWWMARTIFDKIRLLSLDFISSFVIVREMKRKTNTLRICDKLHRRIKKHVKAAGMNLEPWTEKHLFNAMEAERGAFKLVKN